MRRLGMLAPAIALAFAGAVRAADNPVVETMRTFAPAEARDWRGAQTHGLITRIWHPAQPGSAQTPSDIGSAGHLVFLGHPLAKDPLSPVRRTYPLVLLSHGTGGSADAMDWLGAGLAAAGYIVVGVNHPGNTALAPYIPEGFMLWWERAPDLSDTLHAILADPQFAGPVDTRRIGAIGFSLGGYTVLELAGASIAPGRLEAFCASPQADAAPQISDETRASLRRAGLSCRDPRVRSGFAIAAALGEAFDAGSFAEVRIPVALLAGEADDIAAVKTNSLRISSLLPRARVSRVPKASHSTFLDVCAPRAAGSIGRICNDRPGVDRAAVHAKALTEARAFYPATLGPQPEPSR